MKSIKYKGITYIMDEDYWRKEMDYWGDNMINVTSQFQYEQILYIIKTKQYLQLEGRIKNMLKWGGIKIK